MVRPLQRLLGDDTSLLEQVRFDVCSGKFRVWPEMDSDEFTKPRRVIVTDGLGVPERLKYRVSLHDLVFQGGFVRIDLLLFTFTDVGKVRDYFLRVLGLSGA